MIFSALTLAVAAAVPGPQVLQGQSISMGNGTLKSWVELGPDKKPTRLGLTFTESALENLPFSEFNKVVTTFDVLFPKVKGLAFDHASVDYATMGHDPFEVYGVSHFDLHFYLISRAEQAAIKLTGPSDIKVFDKPVPRGYTPSDYIMIPGTEIPNMGVHWVDMTSGELHGHAFTSTLIYGSYNGHVNFIEPMITRAMFENKVNVVAPVKSPKFAAQPGYYPTEYSVNWNEDKKEYTVALGKLTWIKGE